MFISSFAASTSDDAGASIFGQNATDTRMSVFRAVAGSLLTQTLTSTPNNWSARSHRWDTVAYVASLTDDVTASQGLNGAHTPSNNTFRIGACHTTGFGGQSDHIMAMIVDRKITDEELDQVYALAQWAAALDGITV